MRRIRKRLSTEVTALRGANADALIARLNPIITGWAAYYRIGVSKRAFGTLDAHLWRLAWKWARLSHPNKPRRWIIARYFGMFNPARQDKWVLGSRETGFYLRKFAWTKIVRHRMVAGRASPTTPPSPGTGSSGDAATASRWTRRPGTCCAASAAGARSAGDCCCTPTASRKARRNGSSGTPPRARRSASTRSPA